MATSNLTIGDVLPDDLKSEDYPETVLQVPLTEAYSIAEEGMPPTSKLSMDDIQSIKDIFEEYYATGGGSEEGTSEAGGSAYWNKSPDENSAYWSKQ